MQSFQTNFLYVAIVISVLFIGVVISPFLTTLILAAILVTGAFPLYKWVLEKVKGRRRIAAVIMALSIGVIFSLFFIIFIVSLSQEAVSTYQSLEAWLKSGQFDLNKIIAKAARHIKYFGVMPVDLISSISQAAQTLSSTLVQQSTNLLKSIVWLLINFILLVFAMYFFFKDGEFIIETVKKAIPLPKKYAEEIIQKFRQVSLGMLYGIFLTAISQGLLGGIGLAVAGIDNSIFWGTVMGFLGILPVGGTAIVWLPASILLIINNHYIAGVGLLIWGGLIVASIDNVIKPMIISKQTKTYPLATFLVIIGGLMVFGLKGAIIAPMVLVALVSFIHIYNLEKTST